ncbi:hypothetical protein [Cellulosimicrobium sp. CUA-896]|uniref:hypothetical protein n=1 Tax=Cellulosimicrobium sp. CUA-896 TaxID=1517881 RepID=UPI002100966F|nr:hypothetical protein [Cellulosimicrobium sp. CUA-896]
MPRRPRRLLTAAAPTTLLAVLTAGVGLAATPAAAAPATAPATADAAEPAASAGDDDLVPASRWRSCRTPSSTRATRRPTSSPTTARTPSPCRRRGSPSTPTS